GLRQLVDHADKANVAALVRGRQCVGQPKLGAPCRVVKTAAAGSQREREYCKPRAAREQHPQQREQRNAEREMRIRQLRLRLQHDDAERKGQQSELQRQRKSPGDSARRRMHQSSQTSTAAGSAAWMKRECDRSSDAEPPATRAELEQFL